MTMLLEPMKDASTCFISFSGGRTSAYMTHKLLTEGRDLFDRYIVLFANTGREHPKTLEFIRNCDEHFGFGTIWVEAIVNPKHGKGSEHRVVDFQTASRDGEPFEQAIRKHGVFNVSRPDCTRILKREPMEHYLKAQGFKPRKIATAIGIRADEKRRVSTADARNIIYPLVNRWPVDKQDVLDWWEDQPFDLEIEEFQGNCLGCYKKSRRKQFLQMDEDPSVFDWIDRMEKTYGMVKSANGEPHRWFRNNLSTEQMREEHERIAGYYRRQMQFDFDVGGCSESCEMFESE